MPTSLNREDVLNELEYLSDEQLAKNFRGENHGKS